MLPFLKPKAQTGLIVKTRTPDEKPEESKDDNQEGLKACAQDLISAIESKDATRAAEALKAFFEIADSMPHEEGEHVEPHSYEAQNEEAAE